MILEGLSMEVVSKAREAAGWWAGLSFRERRNHLLTWKRIIAARSDQLADVIHAETGKPIGDALLEIMLAVEHLDWAARNAARVLKRRRVRSGLLAADQGAALEYRPLGVIGVIGPWNYPVYTPLGSVSYALAAGNAVVFKPSEHTPATGEWLAAAWREVVPRLVLQVITGDGAAGAALVAAGVDKIAVATQVDIVRGHVDDALARGGRAVVGGPESIKPPYVFPVVLAEVPEDSTAMTEETFGPAVVVNPVDSLDEAVSLANASTYGLAASIFTKNRDKALRTARRLRTGAASINSVLGFAGVPALPFGGVGDSGFGRVHGAEGLREFSRPQSVTWRRFTAPMDVMSLSRDPAVLDRAVKIFRMRHARGAVSPRSEGHPGA
jgi:acyl-CoA reductase-like NAD-dependent aldehyde dehydrogenase